MTTKKTTVNSVATDTAALTEILNRQVARLDKLGTRAVARLAGAIRPLERVMTTFRTKARNVLVARWLKGDRAFSTVDKGHYITFKADKTEVVVQEREHMEQKPTALRWLKKNKPDLYKSLTIQRVTLADGAALARATDALVRLTRKTRRRPAHMDNTKLVEAVTALVSSFTAEDVLHQASVEAAVVEKKITVRQLQKLYEIQTIHALLVNDLAKKEKK
jgi:hypothetical protein